MLRYAPKGEVAGAAVVTPDEDRILRAAFGRYAASPLASADPAGDATDNPLLPAARAAAVPIVRHYQQLGAGCWFLCDCRPDADRPPALVPVSQTHVRRHQDARWPAHCDACDFYRYPDEQHEITASYRAPPRDRPMRLMRTLSIGSAAMEHRLSGSSRHTKRPRLARLLMQLLTDAGLQRIEPGWRRPPLVEQVKAIWTAARSVEIDTGVRLTSFLCTSPARLPQLVARIAAPEPARFAHTRPHGVLITRVGGIGDGELHPLFGPAIAVRGRLAVFGEWTSRGADVRAGFAARAPYLAICVLGRAAPETDVEVLSAYVHPCAAADHLMLVDSDLERRTLAEIRSVQAWLERRKGLSIGIEKPLFDMMPAPEAGAAPTPPIVPDFLVGRVDEGPSRRPCVVVETMGYGDDAYRARKQGVHPLMQLALGHAPLVMHDFHEPAGLPQAERDKRFWRELRWAVTGPDDASGGGVPKIGNQQVRRQPA